MNQRTLEILEYYRIKEEIAGYCLSNEGKVSFLEQVPITDTNEIAFLKSCGMQWMNYLYHESPPSFTGWPDIAHFVPRIRVEGTALNMTELYALGCFCESVQKFRVWGEMRIQEEARLSSASSSIFPLSPLEDSLLERVVVIPDLNEEENAIFRVIERSTGEIRDLPELRAIRQSIIRIRQDIDRLIGSYLTDDSLKHGLQAKLPTIKDGRQVLSVKAGSKNRIKGIIHEVSQSGQTVYIEPEDVVARNNDLVAEEHHLDREIARILKDLTERLCPSYEKIATAHKEMLFFDRIAAAASWGKAYSCVYAQFVDRQNHEEPVIMLKQARHPLLGRTAVPIDLVLTPGGRQLIITGPNTGGKTVSLKTVALLSLMNQSGWPIPVSPGTALPIFDYIGCDIGDEQSLDQSLSTFSGHMRNISTILSSVTEESLVLLDELGSGTDPQEGSAIAMAVLDALMEKNSVVLVTTHHGILKNYGYTHETCINASVEFDHDTLSPTYRIVMGIPGESHALDVAEKNGLSGTIVDKARSYLDDERVDVSALIQGLTSKHEALDSLEQKKKQEEREIHEKKRRVDLKELQLRQKELELREQGFRKLTRLLDEGRKELENLVRKVREGELTREKTLEVKAWMNNLDGQLAAEYTSMVEERNELASMQVSSGDRAINNSTNKSKNAKKTETGIDLIPGVEVYVGKNRQRGIILREGKKGKWVVMVGPMKITVSTDEIEVATKSVKQDKSTQIDYSADFGDRGSPAFELRLLGMRVDEAEKALQRQFDLAIMNGLREFSIIHGKGHGVLQKLVHDFLVEHTDHCSFSFAKPENGGSGKTIVTLQE